jgi:hypothetical protein
MDGYAVIKSPSNHSSTLKLKPGSRWFSYAVARLRDLDGLPTDPNQPFNRVR